MASLWALSDYLWDTFSTGKGSTDKAAKRIEEAGKDYEAKMNELAKNQKSAKDLYQEGKEVASSMANNEAGIAMKNAKAASMQNSGSKLLSAIQGAEAANQATQSGFDKGSQLGMNAAQARQQQQNTLAQAGATNAYNAITEGANLQAAQAQKRSEEDAKRIGGIGTFIKGLGKKKGE